MQTNKDKGPTSSAWRLHVATKNRQGVRKINDVITHQSKHKIAHHSSQLQRSLLIKNSRRKQMS